MTPGYVHAVRILLFKRRILMEELRILGVIVTLLYELRCAARHPPADIVETMYDRMVKAEEVDLEEMEQAS